MYSIHCLGVLLSVLCALPTHRCSTSCIEFTDNANVYPMKRDSTVVFKASIARSCYRGNEELQIVVVSREINDDFNSQCQFVHEGRTCGNAARDQICLCDGTSEDSIVYTVMFTFGDSDRERWMVAAMFNTNRWVNATVELDANGLSPGRTDDRTFTTSNTTTTKEQASSQTTLFEEYKYLLVGVIGGAFVLSIAVFILKRCCGAVGTPASDNRNQGRELKASVALRPLPAFPDLPDQTFADQGLPGNHQYEDVQDIPNVVVFGEAHHPTGWLEVLQETQPQPIYN